MTYTVTKLNISACIASLANIIYICAKVSHIPPKPHKFVDLPLQSSMGVEQLLEIVSEINALLPQFSGFIDEFNNVLLTNNINVVLDAQHHMALDVPKTMSRPNASYFSLRIGVIDNLILTRCGEIESLIEQGYNIENELKKKDSNYSSLILDKANEFKILKASYKGI
jgi:hypothetical protein